MIFSLFFIIITKAFAVNSSGKLLAGQNPCDNQDSSNNLCTITEITENSHLSIESKDKNSILYVFLSDINDDHVIHISQLDVEGQIFLSSNRKLHISVDGDLNINGNVVFDNFYLSISTLNLKNESNFIIDTVTANNINFECDDDFVCPSIRAQNFYSINNNISIQFIENASFNKIHQMSTVLTILDGQSPNFNFTLLNDTSRIVVYEETNSITNSSQISDTRDSFYLVAEFFGCRVPNHYNSNHKCVPCPSNQASTEDGSEICSPCPKGTEYSSESMQCVSCPSGSYLDERTKKCTLCPIGTYQSNSEGTECIKCPENSTTIKTGETSIYACICPAGYYGRSGEKCQQCSETEVCSFGSLYPLANPGHWIDENNFYYSSVCQPKYACFGNSTCEKGYEGRFCGTCSKGYFRLHQGCVKCNSAVPPILAIIMILLVGAMYYFAIYKQEFFSIFVIFINFYQEISMFSYLNSTEKVKSSTFFSYLSVLYFNPQIFQPQCHGLHSYSASIQIAIAIPLCIALILFICSLLSWFIPCCYKFFTNKSLRSWKKLKTNFYYQYNFKDCLNVFKESVVASFYVFFPAYFALLMRTVKFSRITIGKTVDYLDLEPSSLFDDPVILPSRICSIIILIIAGIFVIALDLKISIKIKKKDDNSVQNENQERREKTENCPFKVIYIGAKSPVTSVKTHCYKTIFSCNYWIILFHLKYIVICVAWIYLQRFLIFQYGLLLAIYTIYFSAVFFVTPYTYTEDNTSALLSEFLKLVVVLIASVQVQEGKSSEAVHVYLILASILFLVYTIVTVVLDILRLCRKHSRRNYDQLDLSESFDQNKYLKDGEDYYTAIENFLHNGTKSSIILMSIPDDDLNQKFYNVYTKFVDYAKNSRQDFSKFYNFINLKFRPTILRLISFIILEQPTFIGVFLDRVAYKWKYLADEKQKNGNEEEEYDDDD